ncbi:MAG TPA: hypothetical protein P5256_11935 [Beijerinckiaceae bacterium]|nr:hypothetical protein [Rhodoblastus sp.]MCC2106188.1 hypothetical protein [Hyphomicrobiales bacterium]HRY03836.1 hypothetical protein [Beijerinckiaceae bacterium]
MRLSDALANVVRTPQNEGGAEIESLVEALRLDHHPDWAEVDKRLRGYWIVRWLCTDTWVGLKALYLDNMLVGYTKQIARKDGVEVKFLSAETADLVRAWLIECTDARPTQPEIATPNELAVEIDTTYSVPFTGQILDRQGFVGGKRADFIAGGKPTDCIDRTVRVRTPFTTEAVIPVDLYRMPIHVDGHWPLSPIASPQAHT